MYAARQNREPVSRILSHNPKTVIQRGRTDGRRGGRGDQRGETHGKPSPKNTNQKDQDSSSLSSEDSTQTTIDFSSMTSPDNINKWNSEHSNNLITLSGILTWRLTLRQKLFEYTQQQKQIEKKVINAWNSFVDDYPNDSNYATTDWDSWHQKNRDSEGYKNSVTHTEDFVAAYHSPKSSSDKTAMTGQESSSDKIIAMIGQDGVLSEGQKNSLKQAIEAYANEEGRLPLTLTSWLREKGKIWSTDENNKFLEEIVKKGYSFKITTPYFLGYAYGFFELSEDIIKKREKEINDIQKGFENGDRNLRNPESITDNNKGTAYEIRYLRWKGYQFDAEKETLVPTIRIDNLVIPPQNRND